MKDYTFRLTYDEVNKISDLLGINPIDEDTFPKTGCRYYVIQSDLRIGVLIYSNDEIDKVKMSIGNIFKTREEAEFELERLKVIAKMKQYADYTIKNGYYIAYLIDNKELRIGYDDNFKIADILFHSREEADRCINEVGAENIIKYYFRVKE